MRPGAAQPPGLPDPSKRGSLSCLLFVLVRESRADWQIVGYFRHQGREILDRVSRNRYDYAIIVIGRIFALYRNHLSGEAEETGLTVRRSRLAVDHHILNLGGIVGIDHSVPDSGPHPFHQRLMQEQEVAEIQNPDDHDKEHEKDQGRFHYRAP